MVKTVHQAAPSSYYDAEDYYLDGAETSQWFGRLADHWGLAGEVGKRQKAWLEEGFSPDGKVAAVQTAGKKRFRGNDQTDSPPGEFRVLWGLERDPLIRRALKNALFEAGKDTLRFEEDTLLYARRGRGGHVIEKAIGGLWSLHFEGYGRSLDPAPHLHCRDYNLQLRADLTTGSMNAIAAKSGEKRVLSRSTLYACKMELGEVFAQSLRVRLEALGYRTTDASPRMGHFKVLGVPRELVEKFSTRSKEIAADMKARGVSGAKQAQYSMERTRARKRHVPLAELRERWIQKADGWDPATIREQVEQKPVTYHVPAELRARVEVKVHAQLYRRAEQAKKAAAERQEQAAKQEAEIPKTSRHSRERKPVELKESAPRHDRNLLKLLRGGLPQLSRATRANLFVAQKQVEYVSKTKFSEAEKASLREVARKRGYIQFLGSKEKRVRVGLVLRALRIACERQHKRIVVAAPTAREARSLAAETGIRSTTAASLVHGLTHSRGLLAGYTSAMKASLRRWPGFRSATGFVNHVLKAAGRGSLARTVLIVVRPSGLGDELGALLNHAKRFKARVVLVDGNAEAAEIASQLARAQHKQRSTRRRGREEQQELG